VLFSIARAYKEAHSRVVYFAGYKKKEDLFKQEDIEASTDVVVYSVDAGDPIEPRRPQDRSFVGNIVQAIIAYQTGQLGNVPILTTEAERIIAIGSDRMMAAVAASRHTVLKPHLKENHMAIASINSLMQCMMKAICAQCLQRHVNKKTGKEEFVFTCVNQDQCMDEVDFGNLNARLKTNTVMEKLSRDWVNHLAKKHQMAGV
jgi:NAD(P)H-flavin reductase